MQNSIRTSKSNIFINLFDKKRRILIYAEKSFGLKTREKFPTLAKTADGVLRYAKYKISGVVDSICEEKNVTEVLKTKKNIPVFKNLKQAKEKTKANTLILGIAPSGGQLPEYFLNDLTWALKNGLDIVSGLHTPICSFPSLFKLVGKYERKIWETRLSPDNLPIAGCRVYQEIKKPIVLMVGMDSAIGKLTATYQLADLAKKNGLRPQIIPTGQTGVIIEGWGITIDKCEGDFMAGAVEKMILEKDKEKNPDFYLVEGQGSLFHPAYSTTSLALIHGACPTHLVLVHRPQRKRVTNCPLLAVPKIKTAIKTYENMTMPPFGKVKVVAIALNTQGMKEQEAKKTIKEIKKQTGLPTTDLIRWPQDWTKLFLKKLNKIAPN
jgi:uncharacterized NAD-dependent epimerase/dehydratase family protein